MCIRDRLKDLTDERLLLREPGSGTRAILTKALSLKNMSITDFSHIIEVESIHTIVSCLLYTSLRGNRHGSFCRCCKNRRICLHARTGFRKQLLYFYCSEFRCTAGNTSTKGYPFCICSGALFLSAYFLSHLDFCRASYEDFY